MDEILKQLTDIYRVLLCMMLMLNIIGWICIWVYCELRHGKGKPYTNINVNCNED